MKKLLYFSILLLLGISSALGQNYKNAGSQAFKNKNYLAASANWLEFLHEAKKPGRNYNFKCDLSTALVEVEPSTLARIQSLEGQSQNFIGDQTVAFREAIVRAYDSLALLERRFNALPEEAYKTKKCPMLSYSVGDYSAERGEAQNQVEIGRQKAAEMHYKQGLKRLEMGGLENGRAAYREFARAQHFGANYPDLEEKKEAAHQEGIKRIVIVPLANTSNYPYGQNMGEEIRMMVQNQLSQDRNAGYWLEFVQPEALALKMGVSVNYLYTHVGNTSAVFSARELDIDEIWSGQVTRIQVPGAKTTYSDKEGSAKIKVGEKKVVNDKGKERTENIYETQKYYYRVYTKSVEGTMSGSFSYLEVEAGTPYPNQSWRETYSDNTDWNVFRSGSRKAWDKGGTKNAEKQLATSNERVRILIGQASTRMANQIKQREARVVIPVISTLAEAGN